MPSFRKKHWDGRIHLLRRGLIYRGLTEKVVKFCEDRGYQYENTVPGFPTVAADFPQLPIEPFDYQLRGYCHGVVKRRALFLSPTGSGKTLVIFLLAHQFRNDRVLVIVPTTTLVYQGLSDFTKYGYTGTIHGIVGGIRRDIEDMIKVTFENGKTFYIHGNEYVKTINRGSIFAKDLRESDEVEEKTFKNTFLV